MELLRIRSLDELSIQSWRQLQNINQCQLIQINGLGQHIGAYKIALNFNTKMLKGHTSEKIIKHGNPPIDYLSTLRQKYCPSNQVSGHSQGPASMLNSARLGIKAPSQPFHQQNGSGQVGTSSYNRQSIPSQKQFEYQTLVNKKMTINEEQYSTLTDRYMLKLKDLNKKSIVESSPVGKIKKGNNGANKQVNGILKDNTKQNCQQQPFPNPQNFDSPIKLLYYQDEKSNQKEQKRASSIERKQNNASVARCYSSLKARDTIIHKQSRRHTNIKVDREKNKDVITNVEKILLQIRKNLQI